MNQMVNVFLLISNLSQYRCWPAAWLQTPALDLVQHLSVWSCFDPMLSLFVCVSEKLNIITWLDPNARLSFQYKQTKFIVSY